MRKWYTVVELDTTLSLQFMIRNMFTSFEFILQATSAESSSSFLFLTENLSMNSINGLKMAASRFD